MLPCYSSTQGNLRCQLADQAERLSVKPTLLLVQRTPSTTAVSATTNTVRVAGHHAKVRTCYLSLNLSGQALLECLHANLLPNAGCSLAGGRPQLACKQMHVSFAER